MLAGYKRVQMNTTKKPFQETLSTRKYEKKENTFIYNNTMWFHESPHTQSHIPYTYYLNNSYTKESKL